MEEKIIVDDPSANFATVEDDILFLTPYDYAAIYARKLIKTESHSIPSQIFTGKQVINSKGLLIYKSYWDSESASTYTYDKRNGFCELLYDLKQDKFKTLVVFKRDRLSRNFNELLSIKKLCKKHNVKILYSAPGEFQADSNNYYSDFIENILMGISELESKEINERTSLGRKVKREKGLYSRGAHIPFGLTENVDEYLEQYDDEYELVPHQVEAPIVKAIFEEYLSSNVTIDGLLGFANEMKPSKDPLPLKQSQVVYMLTNPIYIAYQRPSGKDKIFLKDKETKKYTINLTGSKCFHNIKVILDPKLWCEAVFFPVPS
ncbi:Resolvase, N-terminal domain [Alkaliphilus metalliredigens QYMF]|uniref:Resolvase, N-terminal domain n=1 Tax=Alkaliphilus metalliredigens (strain QYMF) TaxID=293826 RepID=A6TQ75_ALKMQ|nr:recombinase family protein [Alkaliphilus metalliredigens]ABR48343.1 Resolvase, N-terminal domain [Alkaliphilus metalliredigens QYMF]